MKKLFVFVLISILSTGQLSWAQNVLCNMDMMESMTIDSQDCCGDNCPCPQAAFSGIALMDNLHKDFPPFLSQRIRITLFSIKEGQPTNPSPPPITA